MRWGVGIGVEGHGLGSSWMCCAHQCSGRAWLCAWEASGALDQRGGASPAGGALSVGQGANAACRQRHMMTEECSVGVATSTDPCACGAAPSATRATARLKD